MEEKLPLNPDTEIFRWGPAPMRFYFNSDFEGILTRFPLVFKGEIWPKGLFIYKNPNMVWVNEYPELRKGATNVFIHYMLDLKAREKVWNNWLKDLEVINNFENKIDGTNLLDIDDELFVFLWREMRDILLNFWTNILVPEYGNYGGDKLLEVEVGKYIKDSGEIGQVMEILTSPEAPSFFQEEEMDLFGSNDLKEHSKKYFWLRNSYNGTEVLSESFFEQRKKEIKVNPREIFQKRQEEVKRKKLEAENKYKLSKEVMDIASAFVKGIEWQDLRKAVIWKYLYYKDLMIGRASLQLKIDKDDLLNFGTGEIMEMLEKSLVLSDSEIKNRRVAFAALMRPLEKPILVSGEIALKYWNLYAEDKFNEKTNEVKGIVVSKGTSFVKGRVRLLFNPKEAGNFNSGEILVAPMTTPEYIFAMRKASAVITDVGGLMSHAAIVSRELGIPCIVGTKIATKLLKDGDEVEVDANNGIVKIIKRI